MQHGTGHSCTSYLELFTRPMEQTFLEKVISVVNVLFRFVTTLTGASRWTFILRHLFP
jgi:hypothetical protein